MADKSEHANNIAAVWVFRTIIIACAIGALLAAPFGALHRRPPYYYFDALNLGTWSFVFCYNALMLVICLVGYRRRLYTFWENIITSAWFILFLSACIYELVVSVIHGPVPWG